MNAQDYLCTLYEGRHAQREGRKLNHVEPSCPLCDAARFKNFYDLAHHYINAHENRNKQCVQTKPHLIVDHSYEESFEEDSPQLSIRWTRRCYCACEDIKGGVDGKPKAYAEAMIPFLNPEGEEEWDHPVIVHRLARHFAEVEASGESLAIHFAIPMLERMKGATS